MPYAFLKDSKTWLSQEWPDVVPALAGRDTNASGVIYQNTVNKQISCRCDQTKW